MSAFLPSHASLIVASVAIAVGCLAADSLPPDADTSAQESRALCTEGVWVPVRPWVLFPELRSFRRPPGPPMPDAVTGRISRLSGAVRVEGDGDRLRFSFDSLRISVQVLGGMTGGRQDVYHLNGDVTGTVAVRLDTVLSGDRLQVGTLVLPDSATADERVRMTGSRGAWPDAGTRLVGTGSIAFEMWCRADTLHLDARDGGRMLRDVRYVRAPPSQSDSTPPP